jgi:potassium/chloride transporter 4/5/6
MHVAAQLQQAGRGINVVISIIDTKAASNSAFVASAVNDICSEADEIQDEENSVTSGLTSDRWRNEGESVSTVSTGLDHRDTISMIRRTKALLMLQMKKEGMVSKETRYNHAHHCLVSFCFLLPTQDGFAEVSTTEGKFYEAVWSAVIHTGLGPLSPNTILLSLPSFTTVRLAGAEHDAESYIRTVNGVLNLGKAVILFKGSSSYPTKVSETPGRKCIDIWWIVYDGGLLLLLPFLLSKHSIWSSEKDQPKNTQTKKRLRRRGKRVEAKLRLFVVATSEKEDTDKLKRSVIEHLEIMRIQAEVVVVKELASTNIASRMRDTHSVGSSKVQKASSKSRSMLGKPKTLNRVASLAEDGISTHHMTIGEVFLESPLPEDSCASDYYGGDLEIGIQDQDSSSYSRKHTAAVLNGLIKSRSCDANLVVTNLPFIPQEAVAKEYFEFVDALVEGVDNVMLVRGSGAEVITSMA